MVSHMHERYIRTNDQVNITINLSNLNHLNFIFRDREAHLANYLATYLLIDKLYCYTDSNSYIAI